MKRLFVAFLVVIGLIGNVVHAGEDAKSSLYPDVPKAVGEPHPEGNEFMRINHMNLLLHDRDQTMRLGDRTIGASLKTCVACHAQVGLDARPIAVNEEKQFCQACHAYAAVRIDCFQCHTGKADMKLRELLILPEKKDELAEYLEGVKE